MEKNALTDWAAFARQAAARLEQGAAGAAKVAPAGGVAAPSGVKRLLDRFRPKALSNDVERITDEWGGFDEDLYDARNMRTDLQKALGREDVGDVGLVDKNTPDVERINQLSSAMPGIMAQLRFRTAGGDVKELLRTPTKIQRTGNATHQSAAAVLKDIQALRNAGIDLDVDQYQKLLDRRGLMQPLRFAKSVVTGEAPLQLTKERLQRGGVFGPGGLLLGDLSMPAQTRRQLMSTLDHAKAGRWGDAWRDLPAMGLGGYGANTWFTYGVPAALTGEALLSEGTAEQRLRRAGAEAFAGVLGAPASPMGLGQMPVAAAATGISNRFINPTKS